MTVYKVIVYRKTKTRPKHVVYEDAGWTTRKEAETIGNNVRGRFQRATHEKYYTEIESAKY